MGHGFSVIYKTAKRMDCYRRQSDTQITYSCLNQPDMIFYPRTREYRQEARPEGTGPDALFISDVQTFARTRKNVEYALVGTEEFGEQECLKIEAKVTYKEASPGFREFTFVFYAAKNLSNLVIGVTVTGKESYASSSLSDIRLDFPDKLFKDRKAIDRNGPDQDSAKNRGLKRYSRILRKVGLTSSWKISSIRSGE